MNGYSQNSTSNFRQIFRGFKALKNFHLSDLRKVFSLMGRTEKTIFFTLLTAAFFSLSVSARGFYYSHTKPAPALGGNLTEGMLGQPQYLNPLLSMSETDQSLVRLIFSGLYKYGPEGKIEPDIAEGMPQISEDKKTYTVKIKPNLVWHNLAPFTAEDVVFTVDTLRNPEFKSPLRAYWLNTTVEKISDTEIKFTNKDVSGPFLHNLILPILPKNVWQQTDPSAFLLSTANLEAIGSGPYQITQINKLPSGKVESIALRSFSEFYNGRPNIENLDIKFFDTETEASNALLGHEIDILGIIPSPGQEISGLENNRQLYKLPLPQYQVLFFNLNEGLTSQDFIREALKLATDNQAIIAEVFDSRRQLPTDPLSGNSQQTVLDLTKAGQILDKAGWLVTNDNLRHKKEETLGITITTTDSPSNLKVADLLKQQWQKLNITVNVDIKPSKQLMEETLRPRKFQVLLYSQKFGADPDPFFFWHSSQAKDPGLNLTGLNDASLDKLLTEARNIPDAHARQEKYNSIAQIIDAKNAAIFLNQNSFFYYLDERLQNINLTNLNDPASRFYDLPNWYLETKRVWK